MKITEPVLIVPESVVEDLYPGGIEGFVAYQARKHGESQRIVRTDQLVVLSDEDETSLIATYDRLCKVFQRSPGEEPPCVFVDPVDGIMEPCDWLLYSPEDDGSAVVLYADALGALGQEEEPAKAESDEEESDTPPSESVVAVTEPESPVPNLMKLAQDGGFITWLDLATGRQLTSASHPVERAGGDEADDAVPMLEAAISMIAERGWDETTHDVDDGILHLRLDAGPLLALRVTFARSAAGDALLLVIRLPGRTPQDRLSAVTAFLAGANWGLEVGGFDIDQSDGEVIYRAAVVAPKGQLQPSAVSIALDRSMGTVKHYAPGLIEVAGGADPRETLARIEKR